MSLLRVKDLRKMLSGVLTLHMYMYIYAGILVSMCTLVSNCVCTQNVLCFIQSVI